MCSQPSPALWRWTKLVRRNLRTIELLDAPADPDLQSQPHHKNHRKKGGAPPNLWPSDHFGLLLTIEARQTVRS